MNFCAKCGRERSDDARYCGGCGTEYAAAPTAAAAPADDDSAGGDPQPSATVEAQAATPPAEEAERREPPADATRVERAPDVTLIDRPGRAETARPATPATAEPDPFAAWFAPDAKAAPRTEPGGQWQAAEPWQAADTVYAGSGQGSRAYSPPPSAPPGPGYPPPRPPYGAQPGPPPGGRRSSGGRKAAFILVVVLVMLAAGGGAYALVSRSNGSNTAQPPASPTTGSSATSATSAARSSASAGSSPSGSPSATPSASSGLVSVGAGVSTSGAEPAVETTLNRYFQGINTHDYAEYQSAHNAAAQATTTQSKFTSGYASTADSGMTLTSLEATSNGGESATVTFISHQAAGTGIDGSSCNNWQVTFFLAPAGTGYLIGVPPSTYKPVYSDC
jgi:hypothetical protein